MSVLAYIPPGIGFRSTPSLFADVPTILAWGLVLLLAAVLARLVGHACSRIGESLFDLGDPAPVLQRPWRPGAR